MTIWIMHNGNIHFSPTLHGVSIIEPPPRPQLQVLPHWRDDSPCDPLRSSLAASKHMDAFTVLTSNEMEGDTG